MAIPAFRDVCRTLRSVIFLQRQLFSSRTVCMHNLRTSNKIQRRTFSSDEGSSKITGSAQSVEMETHITDYTDDIQEQIPDERATFDVELLDSLLLQQQMQSDLPLTEMESPYKKPRRRCILCKYDIELNYKNTQLLSQFTSPYTGRIYGRYITGLCIPMQNRVSQLIKASRNAGFMPFLLKDTIYLDDPKLFDPFKPGSHKTYH